MFGRHIHRSSNTITSNTIISTNANTTSTNKIIKNNVTFYGIILLSIYLIWWTTISLKIYQPKKYIGDNLFFYSYSKKLTTMKSSSNNYTCPNQLSFPIIPTSNTQFKTWLTLGIPTVGRKPPQPYLVKTLQSIADQLSTQHINNNNNIIKVIIIHHINPNTTSQDHHHHHEWFDIEKLHRKDDSRFDFIRMINPLNQQQTDQQLYDPGSSNRPGTRVQQQTRDIINTLRVIYEKYQPEFHLIMEDDFSLCPNALQIIYYLLHRATVVYGEDWLTIRVSYGFNGVLIHGSDLIPLSNYLEKHIKRRPPDHLLVEWFAGEHPESKAYKGDRIHACFRYNLLDHLGVQSTLRDTRTDYMTGCFTEFTPHDLFEVEVFKMKECGVNNPKEHLWPCPQDQIKLCPPIDVIQGYHKQMIKRVNF
jgi:hypothetical protein